MPDLALTPFLLFDGTCAEAMAFYQRALGGELTMHRAGDRVAFAHLAAGAIEIGATDWMHATRRPQPGNTVALDLTGAAAELRPIFDALADGGDPSLRDDLRELPIGLYGHLADRYGVHWFFRGEAA